MFGFGFCLQFPVLDTDLEKEKEILETYCKRCEDFLGLSITKKFETDTVVIAFKDLDQENRNGAFKCELKTSHEEGQKPFESEIKTSHH